MNTNIISGPINRLAAIFSLLFVNIRVHSWLKFFPGKANGHKPQNPLVPVFFKHHKRQAKLTAPLRGWRRSKSGQATLVHRYRYRARKQAAESSVGRSLTRAVAAPILRASI